MLCTILKFENKVFIYFIFNLEFLNIKPEVMDYFKENQKIIKTRISFVIFCYCVYLYIGFSLNIPYSLKISHI